MDPPHSYRNCSFTPGGHGQRAVHEQVREQRTAGLDAVGLEIAHARLVQHRVIDEELPGALARRCG